MNAIHSRCHDIPTGCQHGSRMHSPRRRRLLVRANAPISALPFWQKDLYGSTEWFASWHRRNRVEGLFGNNKNDAAQNVTRGRIRVMGLAKVSIMVLLSTMAANLRLTDTYTQRQEHNATQQAALADGTAVPRQRRKPRWRTQLRA
jgi:hypothetical protein